MPAALPISAPFFFETETAGLMFVRRCWPQRLYWWLSLRFPREDTTAYYECGHDCPENPKLYLLHCGVLRRLTPLQAIVGRSAYQVLRNSSGNLATFTAILRASSFVSSFAADRHPVSKRLNWRSSYQALKVWRQILWLHWNWDRLAPIPPSIWSIRDRACGAAHRPVC